MTTVDIAVARDTWVQEGSPTTNNGGSSSFACNGDGASAGSRNRALLAFDLSTIPAGATINSATIKVAINAAATATNSYDFYDLIANYGWTELGATGATIDGTTAWAGGATACAVHGTDISSTVRATITATNGDAQNTYETGAVTTSFVQSVSDGTGQNGDRVLHLAMARQGSLTSAGSSWRSRESSSGAFTPILTVDYSTGGTALATGSLTLYATDTIIFADAAYSGDSGNVGTATFEYRTTAGPGAWIAADGSTYERTSHLAHPAHVVNSLPLTGGIVALAPSTSYDVRVTWADANGVTGTNPVSATLATKARPNFMAHHSSARQARTFYNYTPPSGYPGTSSQSKNTLADYASADVIVLTPWAGTTATNDRQMIRDMRALGSYSFLLYCVMNEISPSGVRRGGLAFTQAAWDEADAQETWFLHDPVTTTDRVTDPSFGFWQLNPTVAGYRQYHHRQIMAMIKEMVSTKNGTDAFDGVFYDNEHCTPIVSPTVENPTTTAWRAAVKQIIQDTQATGVYVGGNITNNTADSQVTDIASANNLAYLESRWKTWSSSAKGGEAYKSTTQWAADATTIDTLLAQAAPGTSAERAVCVVGQIVDEGKDWDVTPGLDQTAMRFVYLSYLLNCTTTLDKLFFRAADSGGSGYARYRIMAEWASLLGAPTGARAFDATGGGTSPSGIWRRDFQNGYVRLNVDSVTHDTLTAHTGEIVMTPNNPVPSIASLSPATVAAGAAPTAIAITGSGFISGSDVRIGGSTRTHSYVDATHMTVTPTTGDLASAGTLGITVVNGTPGGGTSNTATLSVSAPVPVPTGLSPSSVQEDTSFTLTVTGTNFSSGNVVRINGVNKTTVFVNATTLTVALTAADVADPGDYIIEVV